MTTNTISIKYSERGQSTMYWRDKLLVEVELDTGHRFLLEVQAPNGQQAPTIQLFEVTGGAQTPLFPL